MPDSSADHKHNTELLLFADAIDPLGFAWIFCRYVSRAGIYTYLAKVVCYVKITTPMRLSRKILIIN